MENKKSSAKRIKIQKAQKVPQLVMTDGTEVQPEDGYK